MNKFRCKNSCIRIAKQTKCIRNIKKQEKKILIRILRSACFIFKCLLHLWHFYENAFFSYYLRRLYLFSRTSWNLLDIFYVHLNITSYYFALKRVKSKKGNCIYSWPVSKRYQVYWIQFLINGLVYLWNLWTCSKRSDLRYVWKGWKGLLPKRTRVQRNINTILRFAPNFSITYCWLASTN